MREIAGSGDHVTSFQFSNHDFFFFNDTATPEIYTLSLHDALPISAVEHDRRTMGHRVDGGLPLRADVHGRAVEDRKSTRLNSSHPSISYAVFCLKKKKMLKCKILSNRNDTNRTTYIQPSTSFVK